MDDIQRNLELIDAQRRTPVSALARLLRTAPLFWPAIALMIGILFQQLLDQWRTGPELHARIWIWTALLGLSATIVCVGLAAMTKASHPGDNGGVSATDRSVWLALGASACFLCLGAIRLLAFETAPSNDIRRLVGEDRRLATIRGRIMTEPAHQRRDWCFAQFANADPSCSFYLNVESVKTPVGWSEVAGTVRVYVNEPILDLRLGDSIEAHCRLHRFEPPTNPGQFDLAAHLRRRNVHVGASVPSRDAIERQDGKSTDILTTLRRRFAQAAAQGLLEHAPADTESDALLQALLLGERRDIGRDTYEAFRRTGLLHLISLSGMHLGIFVGMIWWLCRVAGLMKPARAIVCAVATVAFLLVVPPRAPTLRAAVIVWAFCLSILFRRRTNPLNSLSLAAIIVLLARPTQLFEAGWQLSFSAVAGILAFTSGIEHFLHDRAGDWFRETDRQAGFTTRLVKGLGNQAIRGLSAGTAAWLGSAGVLLYHFYAITPLASLWTVLVVVPVAAILMLGFLKIVLLFLLPTVSTVLGFITSALADSVIWIVKLIAQIDASSVLIGHVPLLLILLYYASILFIRYSHPRRPILKQCLCTALGVILLGSLGLIKWHRTHRDDLRLTCLDVGHGQAILVQLPGTMNLLFDAGSLYTGNVGTRIVVPYLDYRGIRRIHAVVLSHGDMDHINGVAEVVSLRRVDRVWVCESFPLDSQGPETISLLLSHLASEGVEVNRLPATLDAGAARIRTIWPVGEGNSEFGVRNAESTRQDNSALGTLHSPLAAPASLSDNDSSLVGRIEFAGVAVLLCSDIERFAQGRILDLYADLRADVVVVPHHGSIRTLDERFLERLGARALLCSCTRQDVARGRIIRQVEDVHTNAEFGMRSAESPRQDNDALPRPSGLYRTGTDGAITVCITADGMVQVSTYLVNDETQTNASRTMFHAERRNFAWSVESPLSQSP